MGRTGELLAGQALAQTGAAPIIEAFASGGFALGLALLITKSETWGQLMDNLNPIIQSLADAFGMLLEPLLPIVYTLGQS